MMNIVREQAAKAVRKKINHSAAGIAAAGAVLTMALIAESEEEKNSPEYARYEIDGRGKAADNVRLVFLTDLHEKEFGPGNRLLLEMIDRADPDAVLIGGDMPVIRRNKGYAPLHGGNMADPDGSSFRVSLHLCEELAKKYPVFYGNGNHEQRISGREYFDRLESVGVTYLSNRTVQWKYNISITGIDLGSRQYRPVLPDAPDMNFISRRIGSPDEDRFNILLAHSPLFIESYAAAGADLVLSGHFHGGTVRLPGEVGLMTPQYQFFNSNVVGIRHFGSTDMVISSGLGTHSINIRINDKPQVVVVDIKK